MSAYAGGRVCIHRTVCVCTSTGFVYARRRFAYTAVCSGFVAVCSDSLRICMDQILRILTHLMVRMSA